MRITNYIEKSLILAIFIIMGSCEPEPIIDPCLKTKWPLAKDYEIKLAVHINDANPLLPESSSDSQKPADFDKMQVNGTIEKIECSDSTSGPVNLGNTYLKKGVDYPAPIDVPKSYWIGHVVYVVEFDNDGDFLEFNITVRITMMNGHSYTCNYSQKVYSDEIVQVPGEMYYYVLLDVYSDLWIKV